jgi:hypothetical protein
MTAAIGAMSRGDSLLQELQQLVEHLLHGNAPLRPQSFCPTTIAHVNALQSNSCSATV